METVPDTRPEYPGQAGVTRHPVWLLYFWSAVAFAILPGFLLGALLFAVRASGGDVEAWQPAAGQAHGHIQLFGWAGLMVLGVAFHFLPRLHGAALRGEPVARIALLLLATGLSLRVVGQPVSASAEGIAGNLAPGTLVLSAVLELVGAGLAISVLLRTLRQPSPRQKATGLHAVRPFLMGAGFGYLVAHVTNLAATFDIVDATGALAVDWGRVTLVFGMYGFLLPIAVGMSVRMFPLYIQGLPAHERLLRASLAMLGVGIGLRAAGELEGGRNVVGAALIITALAIGGFIAGIRIFGERRQLPRRQVRPLTDALQLHVITANIWLVVTAALLAIRGLRLLGLNIAASAPNAETHTFGAGFITLLIIGIGGHLLPGFGTRSLRSERLGWATLVLGNLAVLLFPDLPSATSPPGANWLAAIAGLCGAAAVTGFAVNVATGARRRRAA